MDKKKLEIQDTVIPQIVRNRMNLAYSKIQSEQEKSMKTIHMPKVVKRMIAIVACAAICLCGSYVYNNLKSDANETVKNELSDGTKDVFPTSPFTIKVMAAELSQGVPQPISVGKTASPSWVLSGNENDYSVSYCINLPLSCEGANIKSVTYSINEGTFQIIEPKDDTFVVDGSAYEDDTTGFGQIGGFYDESCDIETRPINLLYLTSYTVNYDKQVGDEFWSNICLERSDMEEAFGLLWRNTGIIEDEVKALNMLLNGVEINVTANFKDGSSSSEMLGLEAQLVNIEPWETNDGRIIDKEVQIFVKRIG